MPNTTQEHISIKEVKNDILLLKNGGGALILQVPAVNFGLLSEREQAGIIYAFAQLINSLSFSIQIFIFSERLNISSYLQLLDEARASQTNPLLLKMMGSYRMFIQTIIKDNEVLDKKFYLVIPLYKDEIGLTYSEDLLWKKIKTVLLPRREQILRQLGRIGLRATQLDNKKLIDLFYNIYNSETYKEPGHPTDQANTVQLQTPTPPPPQPQTPPQPRLDRGQSIPPAPYVPPTQMEQKPPVQPPQAPPPVSQPPPLEPSRARNHPFVVEELP